MKTLKEICISQINEVSSRIKEEKHEEWKNILITLPKTLQEDLFQDVIDVVSKSRLVRRQAIEEKIIDMDKYLRCFPWRYYCAKMILREIPMLSTEIFPNTLYMFHDIDL